MRDRAIRYLYDRCGSGSGYWLVMSAAQSAASALVTCVAVALIASFFDPPLTAVAVTMLGGVVLTVFAVTFATSKLRPRLERFREWRSAPDPSPAETREVWELVVNGTADTYRRMAGRTVLLTVVPLLAIAGWSWHIGWQGTAATLVAVIVPAYYATALSYSTSELLSRPMAEEIAARAPDVTVFQPGTSLAKRLRISVPAYTTAAATLTVGVLGRADGARALAATTLTALVVGVALSSELTLFLSDAVTGPMRRLQRQLALVRDGDFSARAPVVSSDEFGELADDFNQMAAGLAERERIRSAFGTYADQAVADLILSGQLPPEGFETTATILFCDVRGFTPWAERLGAPEVITALNAIFTAIVPIVDRHGGHVDKFLGDGLLAVFGTPRPLADHADCAVEAAREIVRTVNHGPSGLKVACGLNTGAIVAGPIGGAGRLNFSVIGDTVNVAARVEAATRQTGDDVLLTEATRTHLRRDHHLVERGPLALKGKSDELELYAVPAADAAASA
ncbi:adenylate/guanylate cyclase domain-containing protein [Nocardioides jiangxiensis]|uniref:Adenylate/guanylate cyclase domain-containing protein n=1 Tax=Nocardioides jiangxiensis TaxID=3064524 RepID=A0ABT9B0E6_9ACTN|nr:adenylate/guanylate cyclase domain-containing protein [Nocardioides sp. WY-20]MDO7868148.1 adenylate/guanylate cyclase domain-containing protein [Nocardioides sp. WY-20]